jgi:hypothetical protein
MFLNRHRFGIVTGAGEPGLLLCVGGEGAGRGNGGGARSEGGALRSDSSDDSMRLDVMIVYGH